MSPDGNTPCGHWVLAVPEVGAAFATNLKSRIVPAICYRTRPIRWLLPLNNIHHMPHWCTTIGNINGKTASGKQRQHAPYQSPMSIYELHAGSWRTHADGTPLTYPELAAQLIPYIKDMGYTHIELMPIMEHPYSGSWGYQPLGLFAVTSRYGSPDQFKALSDACHQADIGVSLDWVPAHFPEDGHGLARFDGSHLFEYADPRRGWHPDWNSCIYDYGKDYVRQFLVASALFWLDYFHIDGLRVDAVASMLYLDYSREHGDWIPNIDGGNHNYEAISLFKWLNTEVYQKYPEASSRSPNSLSLALARPVTFGGHSGLWL